MTLAVNLLGTRRIEALVRRRRTRAWALTLTAYGLGLVVAWSAFAAAMRIASPATALADVQVKLDASIDKHDKLVQEIAKLKSDTDLLEGVTDHPDWSLLLGLIADANGEQVGLQRITLVSTPGPAVVKGSDVPEHGPWTLALAGAAPNQRAASEFVTRLERLGFFKSVALTETRERVGANGEAVQVDFAVTCVMTERDAAGGARP